MCEGIADELDGIDLGDQRLNKRSVKVIEALAVDPEASVNGWTETQAAYRFFNNPEVTPEQILLPHRQATVRRMQAQAVVLLLKDTTALGRLDRWERRGSYQHVQLAVTPDRLPLGVVATESFGRDTDEPGVRERGARRTREPIKEKESFRWLSGYRHADELAAQCPGTRLVSVADCEAEIYDIFVEARRDADSSDSERCRRDVVLTLEERLFINLQKRRGGGLFARATARSTMDQVWTHFVRIMLMAPYTVCVASNT